MEIIEKFENAIKAVNAFSGYVVKKGSTFYMATDESCTFVQLNNGRLVVFTEDEEVFIAKRVTLEVEM